MLHTAHDGFVTLGHQGEFVKCQFCGLLGLGQSPVVRPDQIMVKLAHVRHTHDVHAASCSISEKIVTIDSN
jgi:hypothetical protein